MNAGRPKIGLALSGGAVRGAAHVGVLRVLHRNGIRPDFVAGSSAGAVVGSAYAAGVEPDQLEEIAEELDWSSWARPTLRLKMSLFDSQPTGRFLRDRIGLTTFEELEIPFAAVCCDVSTGEVVALTSGDLVQAVRASSAIPGLFPPQERDGRLLVDGGIVDDLPVDVVREMGAEFVIAVDLLPPSKEPRRPENLFEIWQQSLHCMIINNHPDPSEIDCLIVPEVGHLSFSNFERADELLDLGEAAAEAAMPALRRALGAGS